MEGNRFSGQHNINYGAMQGNPRADAVARRNAERARKRAAMLQLITQGAGTVMGGVAGGMTGGPAGIMGGAGAGSQLGASAGQAIAGPMLDEADRFEDNEREREMKRAALMQALGQRRF